MSVFNTGHRKLYDEDFLNAGCPPELYDETTEVDNTTGTYVTNFIITAFCILIYVRLSKVVGSKSSPACDPLLTIGYFLFSGGAFFVAGINHAFVERTTDQPFLDITSYLVGILNWISSLSLTLYILKMLGITRVNSSIKKSIVWWSVFTLMVGLLIYILVANALFALYAVSLGPILFAMIAWIAQCSFVKNVGKLVGMLVSVLSLTPQIILKGRCGDDGYKVCFEDCPLDPIKFNHNALFHVILLTGYVILAWAEDKSPSVVAGVNGAKSDNEKSDDEA